MSMDKTFNFLQSSFLSRTQRLCAWGHDYQHKDTLNNVIYHNVTKKNDTQHSNTQHNNKNVTVSITTLSMMIVDGNPECQN
jgi:hypothetical protein